MGLRETGRRENEYRQTVEELLPYGTVEKVVIARRECEVKKDV